jgi:hypothetical protein
MPALLIDTRRTTAPAPPAERSARAQLRRQIARLERDLSQALVDVPPEPGSPAASSRRGGRLLCLAELEIERDRLVDGLSRARGRTVIRDREHSVARARLEAMLVEPRRFKFARVSLAALGQPGCGVYQCQPRLGLVGMLAGWWEVKLSSGCP